MKIALFLALTVLAASSLVACGSDDSNENTDASHGMDVQSSDASDTKASTDASGGKDSMPPSDAGPPADAKPVEGGSDAADASDASDAGTYPAFPVDYPIVEKNAGVVMASPVIVTISFPGDPDVASWNGFGDTIGGSSYWAATTSQYGVGPAASGAARHVLMNVSLPSSISYTQLQRYVVAQLEAAESDGGAPDAGPLDGGPPNPKWPAPTLDKTGADETIYSLFIPSGTAVTDPGTGKSFCSEGGLGYHGAAKVNGVDIIYSVTLECGLSAADSEETAAHEYVESATDPTHKGYYGFDPDHLSWDLYTGYNDELADACEAWQDAYYQETGTFDYWIQTVWSNAVATSGHNPCVPAQPGAYYGMTLFPALVPTVTVNLEKIGGTASNPTKGFPVSLGVPYTFDVGYFSDAPQAPWTVSYDFPATLPLFTSSGYLGNGKATVSIATLTGTNGDKTQVTVTVTEKGEGGFHAMAITWDPPSMKGYLPHYLPIVLVDE